MNDVKHADSLKHELRR